MRSLAVAVSFVISTFGAAWSQEPFQVPPTTCLFAGEKPPTQLVLRAPDQDLVNAVANVLRHTGVQPRFELQSSNIDNAAAITTDTVRYIVYNQELMTKLTALTGSQWSAVAVLAHEVAHHLYGHTLKPGGSRPKEELEADKYSGFILERLGISPEVAWSAVDALTTEFPPSTHPRRSERVMSVRNGWWEAFHLEHHTPPLSLKPSPVATPQEMYVSESEAPNETRFIGRMVFYGKTDAPLVTAGSDVIGSNAFGQPVIVGKRLPATIPGYAWIYASPVGQFGVDPQGRVWKLSESRSQVGYVTAVPEAN